MPSPKQIHQQKIKNITHCIRQQGDWSVNDFLKAFYSSDDPDIVLQATQSLAFRSGKAFFPDSLLTLFRNRVSAGDSEKELNKTITRHCADIVVNESTKAYHHEKLRLSSSKVTIALLTTSFTLSMLAPLYRELLPCLWLLLFHLITAVNDYEMKVGHEKQDKESRASQVRECSDFFVVVCMPKQSVAPTGHCRNH